MRLAVLASFVLAALAGTHAADALVWPDVPDRLAHDLASTDPTVRLAAVEKIDPPGATRATPLLLRALADADASVRVAAAEAAVRVHVKGATEIVLPWLVEHDSRLRLAACDVLRAMPDARAIAPLARALSDADVGVRVRAVEALGAQGSPDAVTPLLGKLDDPNPSVRIEISQALARVGDRRAVVPLIGKVEDSAADVREAVAHALGELGDTRATPALVLQLRDGSAEVRASALAAIAHVHGNDAVDAIAPMTSDRDVVVRRAALGALGTLAHGGSVAAFHALTTRLGLDEDASGDLEPDPVREALVASGDLHAAALGAMLQGASPAVSASIAWILGEMRDKASAPRIIAALRRGTLAPAAALHALIGVGTADDLPVVLELVADDNPQVRGQAFAATHALLDPTHPDGRAVDPLVAVAEGTKLGAAEKMKVVELLGRTAAKRASPLLQGLLGAKDTSVKLAALDALGALGPTGADATLLPLVADHDPATRLHAAAALALAGGAAARDALLVKLTTGTEVDRVAALGALGGILTRAPKDEAWTVLGDALDLSAGGERDAILVALGRAAPVHPILERIASRADVDDRRSLAMACAGRPDATPLLRAWLHDADASVRAEAAWSLGAAGGADVIDELAQLASTAGPTSGSEAQSNATAALARIGARTQTTSASTPLCTLLADPRALVRANATSGLALLGARCGDGATERALLTDPHAAVRRGAAHALVRTPRGDAEAALLARCATTDRSGDVAEACRHPLVAPASASHALLSYIEETPRSDPHPGASYVVELADGLLRAGVADRRGAFFDPVAPDGIVTLRPLDGQ